MSEETQGGNEKKIIIDEDWKGQVEAEREAAQQAASQGADETPQAAPAELPEPSLTFLAGNLFLQGMVSLGLLPNPMSDKPEVQLEVAKHSVDTLQMLFEKTAGNRDDEETAEMEAMLHQMRMAFVEVQQKRAQAKQQGDGEA